MADPHDAGHERDAASFGFGSDPLAGVVAVDMPDREQSWSGVQLSADDFTLAQKYCKYAGSALQYEDVSTAVQNLQKALKLLTTGKE
uniref:Vta1 C-terminal domain-containing protein n=1 Tax=Knipowitschia caucasica TaxID=637954 RepID=A0AAV2K917_KNICA